MKLIKKILFICLTSLIFITNIEAKSYISKDYVSINENVMFNSDEFEIYLELKTLSYATSNELGMLSGYTKRVNEDMYYYHYIFYFYDSAKNEIGSADGYNGMWHETSKSGSGTFLGQVVSEEYIYDNYSVNDVKYYKLFVEKASKTTAENYLYKNIKKNQNGLDEISDKNTSNMKVTIVKNVQNNNSNTNIGGSTTNTDEPIVSNYSLEINVNNDKVFKVKEFIRISNKKQGGAISKTIHKENDILPESIIKIDNFTNEGNVSEKSYSTFNQIIINEESSSFGYDITFDGDKNKDADIIRYVISGDIDIPVERISFKLVLPDEFDDASVRLLNASGKELNKNNYTYKFQENTIVINYLVKVYSSEKVVFELTLPNNYFDNNNGINLWIVSIIIFLIIASVMAVLFLVFKNKKEVL